MAIPREEQEPREEGAAGFGKDEKGDHDSSHPKDSKASPSPSSLASIMYRKLRNMCLAVTCTTHTPMYVMLIANTIYGVALYRAHTTVILVVNNVVVIVTIVTFAAPLVLLQSVGLSPSLCDRSGPVIRLEAVCQDTRVAP
jgi:hypothetical protein